ncbi:MAG: D-glycerate dehydrogenase [Planctomycetota bacterium]
MSIFVTRQIPEVGLDYLRTAGVDYEVGGVDAGPPTREELMTGAARHPVLLSSLTESIDVEVLNANPDLRGVSQMAVGVDNIDVGFADSLGIPVAHTPGVLTDATADLAFALLLAAARHVPAGHDYVRSGKFTAWDPGLFQGVQVGPLPTGGSRVLGILGFGRIGQAVARRAKGFGMMVLAHSRSREPIDRSDLAEYAEFDEVLERSDFLSLHCPLTEATTHLIDAAALGRMKPTAILINTARGPVLDEAALVEALRAGGIRAAGLDVYEREPELAPGLADLDNVVMLPHVGSATKETRDQMALMAAEAAVRLVEGRPVLHRYGP